MWWGFLDRVSATQSPKTLLGSIHQVSFTCYHQSWKNASLSLCSILLQRSFKILLIEIIEISLILITKLWCRITLLYSILWSSWHTRNKSSACQWDYTVKFCIWIGMDQVSSSSINLWLSGLVCTRYQANNAPWYLKSTLYTVMSPGLSLRDL